MASELAVLPAEDWSREKIDLIKQTIAIGATDTELQLFLYTCQRTGLDPLAKQIHMVKRWNSKAGREVATIQTGIDGYRLIADRTGKLAGISDPIYGPENSAGHPTVASVTVYKMVGIIKAEFSASARFTEYVQTTKDGKPNSMWSKMPYLMLGKCAEALALRKAFPADLSGVYTAEEMGQSENEAQVTVQAALLTDDDILRLAVMLKEYKISREEFGGYVTSLGYESARKVPQSRLLELTTWIEKPREETVLEKVAKQSMEALKFSAEARALLIQKYRGDWEKINEELNLIAEAGTAADSAEESQAGAVQSSVAFQGAEFFHEQGDVQCVVLDVARKEGSNNREYVQVAMNGNIDGTNVAVTWHKSLFDPLSLSKGQIVNMKISSKEKDGCTYLTIDDVSKVGGQFYQKGKAVAAPVLEVQNLDAEPAE